MAEFSDERSGAYCMCTREKCSDECRTYRQFRPKPITNADKIRAMTDEELAVFLNATDGDFLPTGEALTVSAGEKRWLDWLRQEVTDGSTNKRRS